MRVYIQVGEFDVETVRAALREIGVNSWMMPDGEVRNVPPGMFVLKITTRSAAQMFNAGAVVNGTGVVREYVRYPFPKPEKPRAV